MHELVKQTVVFPVHCLVIAMYEFNILKRQTNQKTNDVHAFVLPSGITFQIRYQCLPRQSYYMAKWLWKTQLSIFSPILLISMTLPLNNMLIFSWPSAGVLPVPGILALARLKIAAQNCQIISTANNDLNKNSTVYTTQCSTLPKTRT